MTIAFAHAFASGGSGGVTSQQVVVAGTTAGNALLIAAVWSNPDTNTATITCAGESPVSISAVAEGGGAATKKQWYLIPNLATGGSKTVVITLNNTGNCGLSVAELAGQKTTAQPDAAITNNAGGTGTIPSSGSLAAHDAVFAMGSSTSANATAQSGWTQYTGIGDGNWITTIEYILDTGAAASESITWAGTVPDDLAAVAILQAASASYLPYNPWPQAAPILAQ